MLDRRKTLKNIMAITTKKGDEGESHFLGKVVDKDSLLLEAVGSIDELQAIFELIGVEEKLVNDLTEIMGLLVCGQDINVIEKVEFLEKEIGKEEKKMPKVTKFLKFKTKKAKELNWARTVCRRVERRVVSLKREQEIDKNILPYFNRLSDYLFLKSIEQIKK